MAIRTVGVDSSHEGLGRALSAGHTLPEPHYPVSVVYSAYVETDPALYQTFFALGAEVFDASFYYTTALVHPGATTDISVGANGADTTGPTITLNRWWRHGFRAYRDPLDTNTHHEFYYDLPRIDVLDRVVAGTTYFDTTPANAYMRIADVAWDPNEGLMGRMTGFKLWQCKLPVQAMIIESMSPYPVLKQYEPYLWCCIPLTTVDDMFDVSGNGRHFYVPVSGTKPSTIANEPLWTPPQQLITPKSNYLLGSISEATPLQLGALGSRFRGQPMLRGPM